MCHPLPADLWEGQRGDQVFPCGLQGPWGYKEVLHSQRVHTSYQEAVVQTKVRFLLKCS